MAGESTVPSSRMNRSIMGIASVAAAMLLTVSATIASGSTAGAANGVSFAPYADIGLYPPIDLEATATAAGTDEITLGFMQSDGSCNPKWAGIIDFDHVQAPDIDGFRAAGGSEIVSFGGAAGLPLAQACSDIDSLVEAYRTAVDRYDLRRLDFDIEGGATTDSASVQRRSAAIAQLQQEMAAAGTPLEVSLTLPVLPTGLVASGVAVVESARDAGVDISVVNIMTMDYGDGAAPDPDGQMGRYAIEAATSLHSQLAELYPALGEDALWSMVGITPMIGQNDITSELLTVADAAEIADFAASRGIGRLSMWSINRDHPCATGRGTLSNTCSGADQDDWEFSAAFAGAGNDPSTTSTSTAPTTTAPTTTETVPPSTTTVPSGTGDLAVSTRVTDTWGSGYCAEGTVTNLTGSAVTWQTSFETGGTVGTLWNAQWEQTGSTVTIRGRSWNGTLGAGQSAGFGWCASGSASLPVTTTTPPATTTTTTPPTTTPSTTTTTSPTTTTSTTLPSPSAVTVTLVTTSDWGSGYCADATVSTASPNAVGWNVAVEVDGTVTSLWNGQFTQQGRSIDVSGAFWNPTVTASQPTTFGFCSSR